MNNYNYQKFLTGLRWGSFESIAYQTLLVFHEMILCKTVSMSFYGKAGALFGAIFFLARLLNLGFDLSISPFFRLATESKRNFKLIILLQLIIQCAFYILAGTALIYGIGNYVFSLELSTTLLFLCILSVVAEGMQRSIKYVLYFAFDNKRIAYISVGQVIGYMIMVWIPYLIGLPITLTSLVLPLAVTTIIATCFFSFSLYTFYVQLPDTSGSPIACATAYRIFKTRTFTYVTQLITQCYSSNFLIPLFGLTFGMKQAGTLKLASSISYYFSELIKKTFGTTTGSLLSHNRFNENFQKQSIFGTITFFLHYTLICITLLAFINFKKCMNFFAPGCTFEEWLPTIIFLVIQFSEHFVLTYKKFFITEEYTHHIAVYEIIDLILITLSLQIWWISRPGALFAVIISRIISSCILAFLAYKIWKIYPTVSLKYHYYLYPLLASLSYTYFMS